MLRNSAALISFKSSLVSSNDDYVVNLVQQVAGSCSDVLSLGM